MLQKLGLSFFSLDKKRCMYRCWKKTSPISLIFLNKKWIFFIKAKLLLLKSCNIKKKFRVIRSILSFCQRPLVDFWSKRNFYGKTDYMGKISKVSMCLKHVQSPRRIKFWDFFSFKWIVCIDTPNFICAIKQWGFGLTIDTLPTEREYNVCVFRFRTFNLNHSWILSQLSYERVLYIKSFV